MFLNLSILVALAAVFCSCSVSDSRNSAPISNTPLQNKDSISQLNAGQNADVKNDNSRPGSTAADQRCSATKMEGKNLVMKPQTFSIDFDPFSGSCFVTYYNRDYPDPPVDSHYSIYKNDRKIFD